MKIEIDKLGERELEGAKCALQELYDAKEEYAKASRHLASVEMRMAKCFDTVNYLLRHATVVDDNRSCGE